MVYDVSNAIVLVLPTVAPVFENLPLQPSTVWMAKVKLIDFMEYMVVTNTLCCALPVSMGKNSSLKIHKD